MSLLQHKSPKTISHFKVQNRTSTKVFKPITFGTLQSASTYEVKVIKLGKRGEVKNYQLEVPLLESPREVALKGIGKQPVVKG